MMQEKSTDWEINVDLERAKTNEVLQPSEYFNHINKVYTSKYLEALGVQPTPKRQKAVTRFAPVHQCEIEASWDDTSVIARSLRILQAPMRRVVHGPKTIQGHGAISPVAAETEVREDRSAQGWKYKDVTPPHVPDGAEVARNLAEASGTCVIEPQNVVTDDDLLDDSQSYELGEACDGYTGSLVEELTEDIEGMRQNVANFIEELDLLRRQTRGEDIRCDDNPTLMRWGEEGLREVEKLKKKFILPFAAAKHVENSRSTCMVAWQSPEYRGANSIDVPADHLSEFADPISLTLGQILEQSVEYTETKFPLELLTTRRDATLFAALRDRLTSPVAIRLTGLLAHLLYWVTTGHLHPPDRRLPQTFQQSIILTMQELWCQHKDLSKVRGLSKEREGPASVCFIIPVLMLGLKRGVENAFHTQYSKIFNDVDVGPTISAKLVCHLNVLIMNIFDPDCVYASFGALDTTGEAIKLWRKLNVAQMKLGLSHASRMLGREFRTTPMMLLLMNGDGGAPSNPQTRKLLQKSSSDTVLATVSASTPPPATAPGVPKSPFILPRLDDIKRQAVHKTACSRFASIGFGVAGIKPTACHAGARLSKKTQKTATFEKEFPTVQ